MPLSIAAGRLRGSILRVNAMKRAGAFRSVIMASVYHPRITIRFPAIAWDRLCRHGYRFGDLQEDRRKTWRQDLGGIGGRSRVGFQVFASGKRRIRVGQVAPARILMVEDN